MPLIFVRGLPDRIAFLPACATLGFILGPGATTISLRFWVIDHERTTLLEGNAG